MSREILNGLFGGKIIPWERRSPNSERRRELLQKLGVEERYFTGKMSSDDCARFQEFLQLQLELAIEEEDNTFAYSFTLGMLLMMDVMKESETLFNI